MSPGRYVVIGGGLLGAHTACLLAAGGERVAIYSRSFTPWLLEMRASGLDLELVEGELPPGAQFADAPGLDDLVEDADVIFGFAGSSTPALAASDPGASVHGSIVPALAVLETARRVGARRVILTSSGGTVYGKAERHPTPETAPVQPISAHGVNSLAIEMYAELYARRHGVESVVLRFSNVYGPGERARFRQGVIAAWCEALDRGEPIVIRGSADTRRDFLYARDAASAAIAAAKVDGDRPGPYNVGAGRSWALGELIELLSEVAGLEPDVRHERGYAVDVPVTELDTTRLREATGWTPEVSMRTGLEETWQWTRRRGAGIAEPA